MVSVHETNVMRNKTHILLHFYYNVTVPKIIKIGSRSQSYTQNKNRAFSQKQSVKNTMLEESEAPAVIH